MKTAVFASLHCLLPVVFAFAIRDAPILNSTTGQPSIPQAPPQPTLSLNSSTSRTFTHTAFKPKFETTVSGFEDGLYPTPSKNAQSFIDIGSLIISWISAAPTVHYEVTATGFDLGSEPHTRDSEHAPERFEVSATDFNGDHLITKDVEEPVITPPPKNPPTVPINSKTLTPVPITSVVINDQTLTPGGATATIGGGAEQTQVHLDPNGHPVVVVGTSTSTVYPTHVVDGQTLEPNGPPITVGDGFQATTLSLNSDGQTVAIHEGVTSTLGNSPQVITVGEVTATAKADEFQYAVGSSTLNIGAPITVDGTIISMTTDASGATVVVVGGASTTLQAPISIPTIVVDGTTQYVIGTETLAPGHPITIDGMTISMMTTSGATVLVVGDKTTTIMPAHTSGFGAVQTTEVVATGGGSGPSPTPTSRAGAGMVSKWDSIVLASLAGLIVIAGG